MYVQPLWGHILMYLNWSEILRKNFSALLLEAAHYAAVTSDTVIPSVIFKRTIPETAPLPTSGNYSALRGNLGLKRFSVSSRPLAINNRLTPAGRVHLKKLIIAPLVKKFHLFMRPKVHFLMSLQPVWALAAFQSPDLFTIGKTPWTSDQLVVRPLPKHRTAQTHIHTKHSCRK
jgi:hypothetical protein